MVRQRKHLTATPFYTLVGVEKRTLEVWQNFIKLSFLIRVNVNHAIGYHCCHWSQYWDNENSVPKPSHETEWV